MQPQVSVAGTGETVAGTDETGDLPGAGYVQADVGGDDQVVAAVAHRALPVPGAAALPVVAPPARAAAVVPAPLPRAEDLHFPTLLALIPSNFSAPPGTLEEPCKFVVIGNAGTGGTKLVDAMVGGDTPAFSSIIRTDFRIRRMTDASGRTTKYSIFDTAGQERFRSIRPGNCRGASCVLFMGTDLRSVTAWMDEYAPHLPPDRTFYIAHYDRVGPGVSAVPRLEVFTPGALAAALTDPLPATQAPIPAREQLVLGKKLLIALTEQLRSLRAAVPVAVAGAGAGAGAGSAAAVERERTWFGYVASFFGYAQGPAAATASAAAAPAASAAMAPASRR